LRHGIYPIYLAIHLSMEQLLEFIGNHPVLSLTFLVLQVAYVWTFVGAPGVGVKKISPFDVTRLINHDDALVLDVRSAAEFSQGHILNAMHIPDHSLGDQMGRLEKYRSRPIITTCKNGHTGAKASNALHKQGFEKVFTLQGGLLAWEDASLPLSRK